MKKIIILLFSVLFTFHVKAQENMSKPQNTVKECNDLIQYRDIQLIKIWDKTINDYKIPTNAIADLNKYKDQLADDTWYATTNLHILTVTLKLASNTIEDILKIVAPMEAAKAAIILEGNKMYRVLDWVNENKEILGTDEVEKDLTIKAAKEIADLSPLLAIPNLLNNLSENLHSMNDYLNVKAEVNLQMLNFDKAIKKYNLKLNSIQTDLTVINEYKSLIDKYLNDNCKNMPASVSSSSISSVKTSASKKPLLATYQDESGKWIAMGPYMTTDPYETENQALGSLFYSDSDLTFICQRGKFKIYSLNGKVEHDARDIRSALKLLGIDDIPE